MKRLLLLLPLLFLFSGARAQQQLGTSVICNLATSIACLPGIQVGTGTNGMPAWQAFGTLNANSNVFNANFAQLYGMFGPSSHLVQTGSASAFDVIGLWTGVCTASTALLGDGACGAFPTPNTPSTITATWNFTDGLEVNGVQVPSYPITAAEISASVTPVNYSYAPGNVLRYGTNVTPGSTDMYAAIQAALNSNTSVLLPSALGSYRLSAGITIPAGTILQSDAPIGSYPANNGGAMLVCDLNVTPCVTLGGSAVSNVAVGLTGVTVTRASGSVPSGSIGVLVQNVYNPTLSYINSTRHSIGFEFSSNGTAGISAQPDHIFTGAISDAHVVMITWPELRITQSRFGSDGSFDVPCTAYIRVSGGSTTNAAAGPNTLYVANTQFNQGNNTCASWLQFSNQTASSIADVEQWQFVNTHVEAVGSQFISSDSTWTDIDRLRISNSTFGANVPFLGLDPATAINDWAIIGNLFGGSFTMAPSSQINFVSFGSNKFNGAVSITGVANSVMTATGNVYGNGLNLAGSWSSFSAIGGAIAGGTLTNTATGNIKIDLGPSNGLQAFTPALTLGGTSAGMTYSVQVGGYQILGNLVTGQGTITLSAKGSSTGQAAIALTGLPAISSLPLNPGGGGLVNFSSNVAGLAAAPIVLSIGTGPVLNLYQQTATGVVGITDGNITGTTQLRFTFQYFK